MLFHPSFSFRSFLKVVLEEQCTSCPCGALIFWQAYWLQLCFHQEKKEMLEVDVASTEEMTKQKYFRFCLYEVIHGLYWLEMRKALWHFLPIWSEGQSYNRLQLKDRWQQASLQGQIIPDKSGGHLQIQMSELLWELPKQLMIQVRTQAFNIFVDNYPQAYSRHVGRMKEEKQVSNF